MALSEMRFDDFEAQVRSQTGATDYADPETSLIMRWTNVLLGKIYLMTRAIDGAWGQNTGTLTRAIALGKYHAPGDGGSYAYATKTFSGLTGLDQTYCGGWAFFRDGVNTRYFYGLIDSVNAAGTTCTLRFQIGTGAAANIASANLFLILKPNPVFFDGANLGGVSAHNIVKIVDSSLGNMVRMNSTVFAGAASNPSYKYAAYTEYAGDCVFVGKGPSAGSYGTWTLTYDEKPAAITGASSTIDLRPEHIGMLLDEVARWVTNYQINVQKRTDVKMPASAGAVQQYLSDKYKKTAMDQAQLRKKEGK